MFRSKQKQGRIHLAVGSLMDPLGKLAADLTAAVQDVVDHRIAVPNELREGRYPPVVLDVSPQCVHARNVQYVLVRVKTFSYSSSVPDSEGSDNLRLMGSPWHTKARAIAKARRIRYAAFADALDVTESAVGHYLSGRREPTIAQIKRIAEILGMSVSELVEDDPCFVGDPDERQVLKMFRSLPDKDKASAKMLLELLGRKIKSNPED